MPVLPMGEDSPTYFKLLRFRRFFYVCSTTTLVQDDYQHQYISPLQEKQNVIPTQPIQLKVAYSFERKRKKIQISYKMAAKLKDKRTSITKRPIHVICHLPDPPTPLICHYPLPLRIVSLLQRQPWHFIIIFQAAKAITACSCHPQCWNFRLKCIAADVTAAATVGATSVAGALLLQLSPKLLRLSPRLLAVVALVSSAVAPAAAAVVRSEASNP